jgi:hypothetical protein
MLTVWLWAAIFGGLGMWNFSRMRLAECDLRTWMLYDPFGLQTLPLVKRRFGWYGVSRTYGLVLAAFMCLSAPWVQQISAA